MTRPKLPRLCKCKPCSCCFKPQGVKTSSVDEIGLRGDELEALKLYDVDELDQKDAASKMEISQPTFGRILKSAHQKVAEAIVKGRVIRIKS